MFQGKAQSYNQLYFFSEQVYDNPLSAGGCFSLFNTFL
jgi:hypothetical protein